MVRAILQEGTHFEHEGAFADQVGGVRPDDVQAQDLAGGVVGDERRSRRSHASDRATERREVAATGAHLIAPASAACFAQPTLAISGSVKMTAGMATTSISAL